MSNDLQPLALCLAGTVTAANSRAASPTAEDLAKQEDQPTPCGTPVDHDALTLLRLSDSNPGLAAHAMTGNRLRQLVADLGDSENAEVARAASMLILIRIGRCGGSFLHHLGAPTPTETSTTSAAAEEREPPGSLLSRLQPRAAPTAPSPLAAAVAQNSSAPLALPPAPPSRSHTAPSSLQAAAATYTRT